jgi:putative acetyltransferase
MLIPAEAEQDRPGIRAVHLAAFETPAEAALVDALRAQAHPLVSLVAEDAGSVVGHNLFSPVSLPDHAGLGLMGLAPMAVAPPRQRGGIGQALVRAGLERCRALGVGAVVVLGHPAYYPRFGFRPSTRFSLASEYDAPEDAFMVLELAPGHLSRVSGTVRYHPAFAELTAGEPSGDDTSRPG